MAIEIKHNTGRLHLPTFLNVLHNPSIQYVDKDNSGLKSHRSSNFERPLFDRKTSLYHEFYLGRSCIQDQGTKYPEQTPGDTTLPLG